MTKWFVFRAWNTPAQYGYGTEREAAGYCGLILNRNRQQDMYAYEPLIDQVAIGRLDSGDDTDGFSIDDAIVAQAQGDADQADYEAKLYGDDAMPTVMSHAIKIARVLAERDGKDFSKLSGEEWTDYVTKGLMIWHNSDENGEPKASLKRD